MKQNGEIWAYIEQRNGKLLEISLELLGGGRKLADRRGVKLAAILLGHNVSHLVDQLGAYGADRVYLGDAPVLESYRTEPYSLLIQQISNQHNPEAILIGATATGRDLASRLAAKLNTGLSAHCTALDIDESGKLVATVPAFGGSVCAGIVCPDRLPQMATVCPGFLKKFERREHKPSLVSIEVTIAEKDVPTKVLEVVQEEPPGLPLESCETIVAGGYGIGSKEDWGMVEELAKVLHCAVGATRPACDEGWCSLEHMIGQSGKTVHPNLYIAIGISGFNHHLVGIQDSKVIVAINKDPNAPIFRACDYGIVGDFRNIIPCLIEEFKKARQVI